MQLPTLAQLGAAIALGLSHFLFVLTATGHSDLDGPLPPLL